MIWNAYDVSSPGLPYRLKLYFEDKKANKQDLKCSNNFENLPYFGDWDNSKSGFKCMFGEGTGPMAMGSLVVHVD